MSYPNITDPINEFKSLALLYVQSRDLTGLTPEEILDMYSNALDRIIEHSKRSN